MKYAVYPFKRYKKIRFYVCFNDEHGKRKTLSTSINCPLNPDEEVFDKATKLANEKGREIALEYFRQFQSQRVLLLSEYLEEYYYPQVQINCTKSTFMSYKGALTHFLRICGDHPLTKYKLRSINRYKLQRFKNEGIRKTTINIEMRSIKTAFSWAYKNDLLQHHPFRGQDYLFKTKKKKREFTKSEVKRLLTQTEGKMIGLVIRLAYYSGMRIGEMSKLTWNNVNLDQRYISIPAEATKTNRARFIPLGDKAFNIIKILENVLTKKRKENPDYYANHSVSDCYLLQKERGYGQYAPRSIQQKFRRCMNAAELPKELSFHCLRHSFATHLLENGGDLYKVSKLLGHTTPVITSIYYDHTEALNFRDTANLI